jgi:hypothetical protein
MTIDCQKYASVLYQIAAELSGTSQVPIAVGSICKRLGVSSVRREAIADGRSLLVDATKAPKILLRDSPHLGEDKKPFSCWERFVIAHELAHLLLHKANAKAPAGEEEYWRVESICDEFARRLLVPDRLLLEFVPASNWTAIELLRTTFKIADRAKVPWSAAAQRVTELVTQSGFFRLQPMEEGGYKVTISTLPNKYGIGQIFRTGTKTCETLDDARKKGRYLRAIDGQNLIGLGRLSDITTGAVYVRRTEIRLAVCAA